MNKLEFYRRDSLSSMHVTSGIMFLAHGDTGIISDTSYGGKIAFKHEPKIKAASMSVWDDGKSFTMLLPASVHGIGDPGVMRFRLRDGSGYEFYVSWSDVVSPAGNHKKIEWALHKQNN